MQRVLTFFAVFFRPCQMNGAFNEDVNIRSCLCFQSLGSEDVSSGGRSVEEADYPLKA